MAKRTGSSGKAAGSATGSVGWSGGEGVGGMLNGLPLSEYAERRQRVLEALGGSVGLVMAGDESEHLPVGRWRPDAFFIYLTGITRESGAAVVFDPTAEDPTRRIMLLLRPVNPEADQWTGFREMIGTDLRKRYGFSSIMRIGALAEVLCQAARRSKKLACLHPFTNYNQPVSADLATFRRVTERIPGCGIEDRTDVLRGMRSCKSAREVGLIRHAVQITAGGYEAACKVIRPGVTEAVVQHAMESAYRELGAAGPTGSVHAYNPIVGSGVRGTVLHYNDNDGPLEDGDLLVIDSGAQHFGYAADITRTYPVSGKFTAEQRELYELVLEAQRASIAAVKPGATMTDVNNATKRVFEKAGMLDHYPHGIGHQLGLEVHDTQTHAPLAAGNVITIEPGLYIPARKIGIRIEDDILVTSKGADNLSSEIPKSVKDVEEMMAG